MNSPTREMWSCDAPSERWDCKLLETFFCNSQVLQLGAKVMPLDSTFCSFCQTGMATTFAPWVFAIQFGRQAGGVRWFTEDGNNNTSILLRGPLTSSFVPNSLRFKVVKTQPNGLRKPTQWYVQILTNGRCARSNYDQPACAPWRWRCSSHSFVISPMNWLNTVAPITLDANGLSDPRLFTWILNRD